MSFGSESLRDLVRVVVEQRVVATFRLIYILNIISTTGLAVALFALFTMIARRYQTGTRLASITSLCQMAVVFVALLDYLFSVVFLAIAGEPASVGETHAIIISLTYVLRMALLYVLLMWGLFSGGYFAVKALRRR
ncbi:MAG: hypothetical protein GF331_03700 [Chitinivibrionales bacterium]|nr:hypothetical protein [Chitinivibrionales bacterium]